MLFGCVIFLENCKFRYSFCICRYMCCMVRRVVHFMIVNCLLNRHQWTTQNRQDRVIIFIETNKMVIKLHIWTMCPFSPLFIIWRNACQYLRLIKILSAVVYFFFSLTLARDCSPHTHRGKKGCFFFFHIKSHGQAAEGIQNIVNEICTPKSFK